MAGPCPRCGAGLPPEARFCPTCGAPVGAGTAAGEERKVVTVLFADVTGSTRLGEQLDPEHLREVMARYFVAMRREIEAEGGVVEKFIGDAVMAAFGVPAAHEDDPSRAIRAAIRMRERLIEVNEELAAAHGVTLEIRVGINTGEVLASVSPQPGEPMVTGDVVNVASRLQGEASPGDVLVSERTARAARGFRFRDAGPRALKGKSSPVAAYELAETEEGVTERGIPGLRARLIGRDAELDLLRSVFARSVAEGKPNLVTIYGDAGVGKSRLTAEFVTEAEDAGATVLRGRCLPYGDGITYWPLAEILKSFASILDSDPPELALEKIQKASKELLTEDVIDDPARGIAALGSTVGIDDPAASLASLDPRRVQQEVHAAWRSFFSALAARAPVVAVIEDIHWADPALLDLLDECAERVVGPMLFVCPARPDLAATRPTWGGGRRNRSSIALDPLTQEDADRLITELLAIDELPASVHDRILRKAEGNPFFLEEIVRHLIDEGHVVHEGGRWRAQGTIEHVVIPDTVQAVLAARVDLLDAGAKRVLQAAAVVGRTFWPGPVALLAERSRDDVEEALRLLEDRELVASRLTSSFGGEPELAFKHVLTRDVAYASLPMRQRSEAHAAVAGWIEATAGDRRRDFVELLAYHYEEAYRSAVDRADAEPDAVEAVRGKAFRKLLLAAEDAHRTFAVDKALRLGQRALAIAADPLERASALERIGLTAISDYRGDLAWTSLRDAADLLVEAGGDPAAIARVCARAAETPRRWPGSMNDTPDEAEVERIVRIGLANAPEGDTEERLRILLAKAFGPWAAVYTRPVSDEEISEARGAGLLAAEIAMRLERPDLASAALDGASASISLAGDFTGGSGVLGFIEKRLGLLDRIEDPWERGDIYAVATWTYGFVGDYERAVAIATEAGRADANISDGTKAHVLAWRCFAEFARGHWDVIVDELFPEVERIVGERSAGFPYYLTHAYGARMMIATVRSEADAERRLGEIEHSADTGAERTPATTGWVALADARAGDGAWLDRLVSNVENPPARPFFDRVIADGYALLGRWDRVPAFLEGSRAFAERGGLEGLLPFLDRLEGRAALAAGDPGRAVDLLTAATASFDGRGAAWERATTDRSLGEALVAAGRVGEARIVLARALEVFERLRAHQEVRTTRELLAGT